MFLIKLGGQVSKKRGVLLKSSKKSITSQFPFYDCTTYYTLNSEG